MQIEENTCIFDISHAESARFRKIVFDVLSESCKMPTEENDYSGIGTLAEKQMHAAIKRFICPDESKHEVLIFGSEGYIGTKDDEEKIKKRHFVSDILTNNTIYEIQTGPFSPLQKKIQWILDNTNYNISVIHPIAETKWINYISRESGNVEKRIKSPIKGRFSDIAEDLYFFRDFIKSKRFSLVLLMIEAEEYKENISKSNSKRKKFRKYELIPISLLKAYVFKDYKDYSIFLQNDLPENFTVKEYSQKSNIYGLAAYSIIQTLVHIGLVEQSGKIGRANGYRII